MQLLSVSEAVQKLVREFDPVEAELVSIFNAMERVLAEDIRATMDLPPFDNSAMDGFAVMVEDVLGARNDAPVALKVIMDVPAGQMPIKPLTRGKAARIMTGAPVPPGAEAVVPVEATNFNFRQPGVSLPKEVLIYRPVQKGDHIRRSGEDVRKGEIVLVKGSRLRVQDIGYLSMLGVSQVSVYRKPRVAVFSTGDELMPVGQPLSPGKIYDANLATLITMVQKYGGEPFNLGIAADHLEAIRHVLSRAVEQGVDLIVSTAGVSVGAFDFVRKAIEEEGRISFWRVNMRPGKPLAFGMYRNIPILGLPGNPVSAYVGGEIFLRPALYRLSGQREFQRRSFPVILKDSISLDGRETYLRAFVQRTDEGYEARLSGHQGSGNLHALTKANALLIVPSGVQSLAENSCVEAIFLE